MLTRRTMARSVAGGLMFSAVIGWAAAEPAERPTVSSFPAASPSTTPQKAPAAGKHKRPDMQRAVPELRRVVQRMVMR